MWRRIAMTGLVAGSLAACGTTGAGPGSPGLDGTAWVLAALPGRALLEDTRVTLAFEGATASGSDGCNRYSAPYTTGPGTLDIDARAATTMMACAPPVLEQASAFLAAIARAHSYRLDAGRLELFAADGSALAGFTAQPQGLAGTAWQVTGFNNGRQAVVSVLAGTTLTLAFGADGRASGSAGCNTWSAPYAAAGPALSLGPAATTRRFCAAPEGILEQERQFLAALATVATARREADRLELRTTDGALAVSLRATGSAPEPASDGTR